MVTFDQARANRIAAAAATPPEWWDAVADMLDEQKTLTDAIESKAIRYVKTPAGSKKYGEPIGAPIRPGAPGAALNAHGKINFVRVGPKKKPAAGGGATVIDPGDTGFKRIKELTPGERGREKARLKSVIAAHPDKADGERERLRGIEAHESELDATIRKSSTPKKTTVDIRPKRDSAREAASGKPVRLNSEADSIRTIVGHADARISADAAREDARKAKQHDQRRARELESRSNRADPSRLGKPEVLTDRQLGTQITDLQEGGSRATRAQRDRLDELLAERDRRDNGGRRKPTKNADDLGIANRPAGTNHAYGSGKEIANEIADLRSNRSLTPKQTDRLNALLKEQHVRSGAVGNAPTASVAEREKPGDIRPSQLATVSLQTQHDKLAKKKKRSNEENTRLLHLRLELNRRAALDANGQARRLVGKGLMVADGFRLDVDVKVFGLVGDGDWDCSHMTDDDVDYFLAKCLSGRPSVEKLQQANALLSEKTARVEWNDEFDDVEVKELTWEVLDAPKVDGEEFEEKTRHVRTPEGAKKYGKPIGSPITAADRLRAATSSLKDKTPANNLPGASSLAKGNPEVVGSGVKKPANASAPLTDEEYAAHTAKIENIIGQAVKDGKSTDSTFSNDGGQTWNPERAKQQKAIVDEIYAGADKVPNDGKAIIAGGLGGAGKSTTLASDSAGVDQSKFLTVNPDDIKEIMARKGMIPHVDGLSPMEASALIHEESSFIANAVAQRAYADKKNIVWDITMASKGSVEKRITQMRGAGYKDLQAIFVDIPVETSVTRALGRHRRGLEDHRQGIGDGGRYVPPRFIRANEHAEWSSANRATYEALKSQFDSYKTFDNSGKGPKLVDSSDKQKKDVLAGWMGDVLARAARFEGKVSA